MIEHGFAKPTPPVRVVVLGAKGVVGGVVTALLETQKVSVLAIARDKIDFAADDAQDKLEALLQPDDAVLFIAARAPCKDANMLLDNIRIGHSVCGALERKSVAHMVYIGSDAVYKDSKLPLSEASGALHGVMHLAREVMLRSSVKAPLALLRSALAPQARTKGMDRTVSAGSPPPVRTSCCSARARSAATTFWSTMWLSSRPAS